MKKTLTALAVSCTLLPLTIAAQAATLIHAGKAFTGTSNELKNKVTIVIEGNKIESVKNGFVEGGKGDSVIDLKTALFCQV